MSDLFSVQLQKLEDGLDKISRLLKFLDTLKELGGLFPVANDEKGIFITTASTIRDDIRNLSADFPIFSGTLLLFAAGQFELFVRASFECLCDSFAEKCENFNQLPKLMQENLMTRTAEIMTSPNKFRFDKLEVINLLQNLSKNLESTEKLGVINSVAMSITENNMRPNVISDLFKRIGIVNIWTEFSQQTRLKIYFESHDFNEVDKKAKAELETLMTLRNRVVHPEDPAFPDVSQVEKHVVFLKALSQVIADVCRMRAATFKIAEGTNKDGD